MHGAVTRKPALIRESFGPEPHAEMALSALAIAGMATVLFTFVQDLQLAR